MEPTTSMTLATELAVAAVENIDPDSVKGRAVELRRAADTFACADEIAYESGIKAMQRIKKSRRLWKEQNEDAIRAARAAAETVRHAWSVIDDEFDAAYESISARCETWAIHRREQQRIALQATSAALEPTVQQVHDHLNAQFDTAIAVGDEAHAQRILDQTHLPHDMLADLPPPPPPMPSETYVPKVAGASLAVPYTWELLDEKKLPLDFLTADRKKITALVRSMKAGAQRILGPGVLVRPDTTLRVRER